MSIDIGKLFLILLGSLFLVGMAFLLVKQWQHKLMLNALILGLFLYNGVGAAMEGVDSLYVSLYFFFGLALIVGFALGLGLFLPMEQRIAPKVTLSLENIDRNRGWKFPIYAYILLSVVPLIWPAFELGRIFSPPSVDLRGAFAKRFEVYDKDIVTSIAEYARYLLLPFFYVALYRYRFKTGHILLVLCAVLYLNFVSTAYAARGDFLLQFGLLLLLIWYRYPARRAWIVAGSLCLVPAFVYLGYWYQVIRIGGDFQSVSLSAAWQVIAETEFGFPRQVGGPIIESGDRVDLGKYFLWMLTLPFPKILTGAIEGARINYEISAIVLNIPVGSVGWYVVLPGLVAESVYIYGTIFFWLHGIFIGIVAAFFCRLVSRVPQFTLLHFYLVLMFAYTGNRGGIGALLPVLVNYFLLFYMYLLAVSYWNKRGQNNRGFRT